MTTETAAPKTETKEFQAEVKKLLDIVIHSLYTERDIFLRELVSNAADALEKFRHQNLLEEKVFDGEASLEINISCNEKDNTLTIIDSGIGMTRDELVDNLGTIAHSGSKTFFTKLGDAAKKDVNLIGQFGVGFYAAFMVAHKVRVQSRSYRPDDVGHEWSSDASGTYTVSECSGLHRGTKIILELNDDAKEYAQEAAIKRIIKQYSNFVPFPIKMAGEEVNTVQAVWTRSQKDLSDDEYNEFYKFIANAIDEPTFRLHFTADAPLSIKSLLFTPKENFERMGFGRMEPGVSLYCQKVLIEQHSENILPEWLRFVRGVVDSEDLPLNISRQALQDNALVVKLNTILTKRYLKHLAEEAKNEPEKYLAFYKTFGMFLKEGATQDFSHREAISKLLRFESSNSAAGEFVSLDDYVGRMQEDQTDIYYINGASREAIEAAPYVEAFRKRDLEVIYTLEPIDDFVFSHLGTYGDKKLVSADRADIELPELKDAAKAEDDKSQGKALETEVADSLTKWIKEVLGERVKEVHLSKRLEGSPAIIVNPDGFMTASMERVMRASSQDMHDFGAKNLEINPKHSLIKNLPNARINNEAFAKKAVEQIFDNAMMQAGLMVEPRTLVERSYAILAQALKAEE